MGWLIKKNSIAVICLFLSLFLSCTQTPTNPFAKDKTTAALVIHSSPTLKALGGHLFTDTLGAVTQLGIASNLIANLDTVQITIVSAGAGIDTDVIITNFTDIKDTAWVSYTCRDTGTKIIYTKACVQDWNTLKDTAFLTVYARPNHPPRILVSGQLTISAGTLCSLSVVASDPDAGQTLLYSIGNGPSGAQFDTISKIFKWTPGVADTGTDTILFKVVDNGFPPMADSQKVAVTVSSSKVNHAPQWQINSVNENAIIGTALNLSLSEMGSDPDGDSLSFILLNGAPARDTIINGIYSWTPFAQDTGSYSVHIVAQDPQGLADTLLIHLTVNATVPTNHKPMLIVSGVRNIKTGTTCMLTPSATDPDSGQTHTFSVQKQPVGSTFNAGIFTWTPPATFKGVDTTIFIVIDNGVPPLSDTMLVQITVSDSVINHPPKWKIDTVNLVTTVGTTINLTLSDKCADPDGDSLAFTLLSGNPAGDSIKNSVYSFTPTATDTGVFLPQIIAKDPLGLSDTLLVHLTVTAGDRQAPYLKLFSPIPDSLTVGTSSMTVKVVCKDPSGVASVKCSMGTDTFAVSHTDSTYAASVSGLKTSGVNEILFIATDASVNANRDTLKVHVKYDPTIGDNVPPALHFVNPSKDTVTPVDSFVVQAICYDASRIFSLVGLRDSTGFTLTRSATTDSLWTGTAKGIKAGQYSTLKLIATDSSTARNKDTVSVRVKYDNDVTDPAITMVTPSKDSAATNSSSYTVTLQCTDASGVLSVNGVMGTSTFTGTRGSGSNWTITINGLTSNAFNTIIFTAIDSSLRTNKTMDTLHIKYDPTMLDTIGPTIQQLSGPHSGDIVSSSSVTIVDTVYDPSSVDSVYWTLNKGAINTVTGSSGKYSISVALSRENLDTIVVTAVDNATRHNHSAQTIILNFIKAPAITTQPASQAVCSGGSQAMFTVAATGTPPLSYQWRTGATSFTNIGANSPACTLKNATTTTILSCMVSNQASVTATSNLCTLTVNPIPATPTNAAATSPICSGATSTLTATNPTSGATLHWYTGSCGGTAVGTGTSVTTGALTSTTTFYVRAETATCFSACTSVTVAVNPMPATPTNAAATSPICSGATSTLTATNPTSGAILHWYTGSCGGSAVGIGASVTTGALTATTTFYVRAESGTCFSPCASVQVTVNPPPAAPTLVSPKSDSNGVPTNTTLTWNAISGTITNYIVQVATNIAFTNPLINATVTSGTSEAVTTLNNSTRYYWRVCATNPGCQGPWTVDSFTTFILWTAENNGLSSSTDVKDIASTNGNLYIGTGSGVYFSSDNGNTWTPLTYGPAGNVDKIVANGAIVAAATTDGISRSLDNGNNWSLVLPSDSISNISGLAINGTTIYTASMNMGFYYSTDAGAHWTHNPNMPIITALAVDGSSSKVWAGVFNGGTATGKLYFSSNNGSTWDSTGSFGTVAAIAIVNSVVYAADNNGVYFLNGSSWTYGQGSPTYNYSIAGTGTKIFAAFNYSTNSGVFSSLNNGKNWVSTGPVLGSMVVAISGGYIFTGTVNNGIFRSPLP